MNKNIEKNKWNPSYLFEDVVCVCLFCMISEFLKSRTRKGIAASRQIKSFKGESKFYSHRAKCKLFFIRLKILNYSLQDIRWQTSFNFCGRLKMLGNI